MYDTPASCIIWQSLMLHAMASLCRGAPGRSEGTWRAQAGIPRCTVNQSRRPGRASGAAGHPTPDPAPGAAGGHDVRLPQGAEEGAGRLDLRGGGRGRGLAQIQDPHWRRTLELSLQMSKQAMYHKVGELVRS